MADIVDPEELNQLGILNGTQITLKGRVDEVKPKLDNLLDALRKDAGDQTITIRIIKEGSVIIIWDLVTHLATARLVVSNRNETTEIETVEIVHEALIKAWPDLRKWIEENDTFLRWKKRLKVAFLEWERNENKEGYLLQGAPLGEAEGYLLQQLEDISKAERVFIQLGLGLRDRQKQEQERLRQRIILGLSAGLAPMVKPWLLAVMTKPSNSGISPRARKSALSRGIAMGFIVSVSAPMVKPWLLAVMTTPSNSGMSPRARKFTLSRGIAMGFIV